MTKPRRIPVYPDALKNPVFIQLLNDIIASLEYILPAFNESIGQVVPKAEFLRDGMPAFSDGTNWNPGQGKGLYLYNLTTTTWEKLGWNYSGTYTPTLTNITNLDGSTAFQCQYLRVGSVVHVSGLLRVDPTLTTTSTELRISLPIASNFAAAEDCGGVAFSPGVAGQGAAIYADTANDTAYMRFVSGDTANRDMYFTFTYRII